LSLRDWLPDVLPGCKPWVSSEDIAKGKSWADELHSQLAKAKVTIVCITPENVRSPWLYYEAGFIAAKLTDAAVCPYLLRVPGKLVSDTPLARFQWTQADKTDTLKLIFSLHRLLGAPHNIAMLEGNFKTEWPSLKRKLDKVSETLQELEDPVTRTEAALSEQLTPEAKDLLLAACEDQKQRATIIYVRYLGGIELQAGSRNFIHPDDARSAALWKGALDELVNFGLVEALSYKQEVFEVTREGWVVYDQIKPITPNR